MYMQNLYFVAGVEDEYQICAKRKEEKESVLNDAQANMNAMIVAVEQHTQTLSQLEKREEEAKHITETYPDRIKQLKIKTNSLLGLFSPAFATSEIDSMDTSQ